MAHRILRFGALSAAVATALVASGAWAAEPLKIGAVMPLTGELQPYGETSLNGIKLAIDEVNKAGGVLGQPVQLSVGDDQTSPQPGVDAAQKLVSVEKVNVLLGAMGSGVTIPIAKSVTSVASIPQISGSATSPVITGLEDKDFLFRTVPSDAFQGVALAQVAKEKGYKSVAILHLNNDYGQGLAEAFNAAFAKTGGKVTGTVAYEPKQATYRGELQKAAQGKPEALVLIGYTGDGIPLLRNALEGGFFSKFLFSDGLKSPEIIEAIGAKYLNGTAGTAATAPENYQAGEVFKKAYEAKYGQLPPKPYIDTFYDATYLYALAAEKAKKTDGKSIRDALRDVANAPGEKVGPGEFAKAKQLIAAGKDIDYVGASGTLEFDAKGDVGGYFGHWEIKDGKIETIKIFEPKI